MMKLGYISRREKDGKPFFKFLEASYSRRINRLGDRVFSKLLLIPVDFEDVSMNTEIMQKNTSLILVGEPFILDDDLRERITKWVEWANKADPSEYDPLYKKGGQ